jgi:hypothetical protein
MHPHKQVLMIDRINVLLMAPAGYFLDNNKAINKYLWINNWEGKPSSLPLCSPQIPQT